ncbi:hypothetical protein J5N97_019845 [Dioscorea zingiberensis]|uniref:Uncharacterized protein n=1 Tax=Dioscorea zingiberensis TaxID=325984 RepID=A0A9D5CEM4_9LILI|nr:hypothetical protein J5N97_019845 [Dioscorea zingiberensis]
MEVREQWLLKDGKMEPKPDAPGRSSVSDRTTEVVQPDNSSPSSSRIPFYPLPRPQPPLDAVIPDTQTVERRAMQTRNRREALERQETKRRRRISCYSAIAEQRRLMEAHWKSPSHIHDSSSLNNDHCSSPVNTMLELRTGGNLGPSAPPFIFQLWYGYPCVQLMGVGNGLGYPGIPYMMPCCWVPMGTHPTANYIMPTMIPVNPVSCVPTARQGGTNSPAILTIENDGSAFRRVVSSNDLLLKNSSKVSQKMHHGDSLFPGIY